MKKLRTFGTYLCLLASVILFMNGCATIFKGATDTIGYSSDPSGAKVYVNGMLMGTTPFQLELKSNATYSIEFRKEGYENRTVILNSSVGGGWILLDIITGLVPIIIDAATGNWYGLDQDHVSAVLERQQGQTTGTTTPEAVVPSTAKQEASKAETGNYSKIGTGHWIKHNLNDGKTLILEDGSIWEISPVDVEAASKWSVGTPMSVAVTTGDYPYQLINVGLVTAIQAKYKGQS